MAMKRQRSLKLNFIMNAILTMSSVIFPLITFPYVSRILLSAGTGKVSFATSLVNYFTMFAHLGIPTYGIRACAKVRDDKLALSQTVHELLWINLVTGVISYLALFGTIALVPRVRAERPLFLIMSVTILLNGIGMEWLYRALEQYTYITVRSIVFKVIAMAAMFALVHEQSDYVIYGAISIFAASASQLLNFFNARKYIYMRPVRPYQWRRHLRPVLVFFAMSCATTVYTSLDEVMLGFMCTDSVVGHYHAAVRIKTILVSIVTALGTVLLPRASYYIQNKAFAEFDRITRKAINFVCLVAIPLVVYFILFAREGILLLSGPDFMPAIPAMQVIMPTVLLIGLTNVLGIQILVPLGGEKVVLRSEIAGAVVDLLINLALIPSMGAVGAAIGTLVAEVTVLAVQYAALRERANDALRQVHHARLLIGVGLACAGSVWVKWLHFGSFATLALSAIAFFGIYGGFLLLRREPLAWELTRQAAGLVKKAAGRNAKEE